MRRLLPLLSILITGCAQQTAFGFYDRCGTTTSSFVDYAACGRVTRVAYCQQHNNCGVKGDNYMQYADSLSASVQAHEISDAEARRKWIEFRLSQDNAAAQIEATESNSRAYKPTKTCVTNGNVTNCF